MTHSSHYERARSPVPHPEFTEIAGSLYAAYLVRDGTHYRIAPVNGDHIVASTGATPEDGPDARVAADRQRAASGPGRCSRI